MTNDPHQHLKDYKALLDELDGRTVRITVVPKSFDRAVKEALDRLHRRERIAGN